MADISDIPEHLLRRSAEARARARGVPVEQVLAEWKGEAPPPADEPVARTEAPEEPTPAPAAEAQEAAEPAAAAEEEPDGAAEEQEAPAPERVPAAAAAPGGGQGAAPPSGPTTVSPRRPEGDGGAQERLRSHRLLTVVKSRAIQQVKAEPIDRVSVWPHLLAAEFTALLAMTAFLTILSAILTAPLLELANFNATPNPSKAPWYFLGLQELLSYFDPQIAGVTIPGIAIVGLMAIPYIDRNPSNRPSDRKFAIFMFTFFLMFWAVLVILGTLFRGPGFNFTYPWADGIWFDDLQDWFKGTEWFEEQHG